MLIKGLCDYYDILKKDGKVLKDGESVVPIKFKISLTEEGTIDEIIPCNLKTTELGGKIKQKYMPKDMIMPERTEKSGIDANIIEHRPIYIFGLNLSDGEFSSEDRTGKAKKSHETFKEKNLEFIEGIDSPVVNAYRKFILNWKPEEEKHNANLLKLGKNYSTSGFAFVLSGEPDKLLHEDEEIKARWEDRRFGKEDEEVISQCAVTGEKAPIARIHSKIRGIYGGLSTGGVLVGFNNSSENSYGNEQSYNGNISKEAMKKYTEALNYLLKPREKHTHKIVLSDITIIFWAMNSSEEYEEIFLDTFSLEEDKLDGERTEAQLESLFKKSPELAVENDEINDLAERIDMNTDFYIAGLKPNSSRISIKFVFRKKFGEIIENIAEFQNEVQVKEEFELLKIDKIKGELISPKSENDKVNPNVLTKLFEAVIHGRKYPASLLETLVRRVKTDKYINDIRAGIIKAYLIRNEEEELKVALDKENHEQAYLCGRLFAVLEKLQKDALGELNTTIKDRYFSSAASKPAVVLPRLINLSRAHLKSVDDSARGFYNKLMGDVMDNLEGGFPIALSPIEQGKFIIGYYQQGKELWKKREQQDR